MTFLNAVEPHLPILLIIVPLFGALMATFMRSGTVAWFISLVVSVLVALIAWKLLNTILSTGTPIIYKIGNWEAPIGIVYKVDQLSGFVLLVIAAIAAVMMPFARRSIAAEIKQRAQPWYYAMYLLCLAGLMGIVITGDAFNAFVFLEISSLATYVLIALGRHRRALLAAYQYLIMGTIGATLYVIGIGLLYVLTGTLNFDDIASRLGPALADPERRNAVMAALGFAFVGVSLKLALFPMHVWLPNAYTYAPSVATAFLAGTATKAAIYLLIRLLFTVFGVSISIETLPVPQVLIVLSIAAMFLASFSAVFENNAKRMLAYSSIAQVGYIMLGVGLACLPVLAATTDASPATTPNNGMTAGLVHIANHAIMKAALFLALGAVYYRIGSVLYKDIAGIGRTMPLTMLAFGIAGLGLMGTPGTAGFISKWYLALGAIDTGWYSIVFLIVASSLISLIYIGRITEVVWFREPSAAAAQAKEAPLSMLVPLWILALLTIYLGLDTRATVDVAAEAAKVLVGGIR
ncbi:MAG: monovalent cation/H+ antiporter subunit D family protein [Alphaproteobacteria bacterium]|nr:monovalent cation/H+ antiporter subunit D family protein [Alphaproteobacteria bacterium]